MPDALEAAGQRIEAERIRRGVTQAQAAEEAGVSDTSWNVAENGRSRLSARIAGRIMLWCGWTPESYARLLDGDEPERTVIEPIDRRTVVASGGDLEELRRLDPEYAAAVQRMIDAGIAQARARRP